MTQASLGDGFHSLFDGKTLAGWRTYGQTTPAEFWSAQDGELRFTPADKPVYGHDLITEDEFTSFDLRLEWKLQKAGNSGVFFHIREAQDRKCFESGPEFQLLDDDHHPDARNGALRHCGACYGLYPPLVRAQHAVGEWNSTRIVVEVDHVQTWLNGQLTCDYTLGSDDWNARVKNSKFAEWPSFASERRGHILLQDHLDPVAFRNIQIRAL